MQWELLNLITTNLGNPSKLPCLVDLATGAVTDLVGGNDFYASPRLSEDGGKLAYVTWNHPNMPWDDTELFICDVADSGDLSNHCKVGTLIFLDTKSRMCNLFSPSTMM